VNTLTGILRQIREKESHGSPGVELLIETERGPVDAEFPRTFSPIERVKVLGAEVEYRQDYRESVPDRYGVYAQTHEYELQLIADLRLHFQVVCMSVRNPHGV